MAEPYNRIADYLDGRDEVLVVRDCGLHWDNGGVPLRGCAIGY
jgi:hypothetical protein